MNKALTLTELIYKAALIGGDYKLLTKDEVKQLEELAKAVYGFELKDLKMAIAKGVE